MCLGLRREPGGPVLIGIAAAGAGAVLAYWLATSSARRQLAEQRAALAAELAATRRDNEWLTTQVDRERAAVHPRCLAAAGADRRRR